jgi:hypothetical protein
MVEFILLAIFAVFFIIIFFVIFAEFVLYVCEKVFGKRRFGLIEELPPPLSNGLYVKRIQFKQVATSSNSLYRPNLKNKNQLKVALFGGSAAQGYSSERSAAEMLADLIRDQAPDMDVYVANYAANGGSFHRFQAEILKSVIDFYDILVVYAGNNEDIPYWEHNGVWSGEILADQSFPDPQAKFIIEEEGKALRASLTFFLSANFLNYKSRLYAFCVRV